MTRRVLMRGGLILALCSVACTSSKTNTNPDGGVGTGDGGTLRDSTVPNPDVLTLTDAGWVISDQPACSGTITACTDGKDNDGDGKIDSADGECVGPCDNDEASFATGIPGDNSDACKQDCFFDGNSGAGDDKCDWNLKCDPLNPGGDLPKACPYNPGFKNCPSTQTQACIDNCRGLTPNGCDCFGCCEIFTNGTSTTVFLGSGPDCTVATPQNCAPCTQNDDCVNTCGNCELCLGKTIDDLRNAGCFFRWWRRDPRM